ncbi:hypothetical protein, variant 2 [Verruconis gallopava]|uniref:DUF8035 domain-containing protein n=1 Tax=Verruconis gallopava TaxID=253628 RepID=A0A0D2B3M7_9PEZI|nr:hypothetical protein, variant 2 [Verruconis gallopava]KIW05864.1 hypothetical protein, variant 2 [Verruconis gallopava]
MSRFRSTSVTVEDEAPQRWDREKFERIRNRGAYERDDFRFDERDRYGPRGVVRDVAVEDRIDRRGPRGRFDEDFRYYEEDRLAPGRRRMSFLDEPVPAEAAHRALAPYRSREYVDPPPMRRPARPMFVRRQSSLDTFDRRPLPRYGDEYRLPSDVPIPLPIRRPRSPPRHYYDDYEEVSYRDLPARGRDYDEYRDIKIKREKRSRSRRPASVQSSSSSESSFEEITVPEPPKIGKKGKTRMPKRLVHKKAIIEMGLPFEEEGDFIIVQRALMKEHIDTIIEKSKAYREEKTVFKYTEDRDDFKEDAKSEKAEEKVEDETVIKKTTIIEDVPPPPAPPPPMSVRAPSPARTEKSTRSHHSHHTHHSRHPAEETKIVERETVAESNHIGGPLTVLAPQNRHRDEHDIQREIRELERERRLLKLERESRDGDYELIERVDRWEDGPRRDRARTRSRAPNPKLVALAMSTLA